MLRDVIKSAKTDLSGNVYKSSNQIFASAFFFAFFVLYSFTALYLLVFDTSLIAQFDIFSNPYFLASVCAAAVLVGFVLLVFAYYCKFKRDVWFLSFYQNITAENISVSFSLKILSVYILTAVKKGLSTVAFLSPGCIFAAVLYKTATRGIDTRILAVLSVAAAIIFFSGLLAAAIFVKRYALVPLYLAQNRESTIKDIFSSSKMHMNAKCGKLFALRLYNLPKKIISLLLLPAPYFLSLCRISEMELITGKTNSLIRKRAQREKAVVYYFGNSVRQN